MTEVTFDQLPPLNANSFWLPSGSWQREHP